MSGDESDDLFAPSNSETSDSDFIYPSDNEQTLSHKKQSHKKQSHKKPRHEVNSQQLNSHELESDKENASPVDNDEHMNCKLKCSKNISQSQKTVRVQQGLEEKRPVIKRPVQFGL